jgi:hypothetical protein
LFSFSVRFCGVHLSFSWRTSSVTQLQSDFLAIQTHLKILVFCFSISEGCIMLQGLQRKLDWVREAALVVDARDPNIAPHVPKILEALKAKVQQEMSSARPELANKCRVVLHVLNGTLLQLAAPALG